MSLNVIVLFNRIFGNNSLKVLLLHDEGFQTLGSFSLRGVRSFFFAENEITCWKVKIRWFSALF